MIHDTRHLAEVDLRCEFDLPKFTNLPKLDHQPPDSLGRSSKKLTTPATGSIGSEYTLPNLEELTLGEGTAMRDEHYEWFQQCHSFSILTRDARRTIKHKEVDSGANQL